MGRGNYSLSIPHFINHHQCASILHSFNITLPYNTQQLSKAMKATAAIYLACGVDVCKSHVCDHVELMLAAQFYKPIDWLNRMIQFKEKSLKGYENVGVAQLTYPVLMASGCPKLLLYV